MNALQRLDSIEQQEAAYVDGLATPAWFAQREREHQQLLDDVRRARQLRQHTPLVATVADDPDGLVCPGCGERLHVIHSGIIVIVTCQTVRVPPCPLYLQVWNANRTPRLPDTSPRDADTDTEVSHA